MPNAILTSTDAPPEYGASDGPTSSSEAAPCWTGAETRRGPCRRQTQRSLVTHTQALVNPVTQTHTPLSICGPDRGTGALPKAVGGLSPVAHQQLQP